MSDLLIYITGESRGKLLMYLIVKVEDKIKIICNRCSANLYGKVDPDCTLCGGKGVHNKNNTKWKVRDKPVYIKHIERSLTNGHLRYWEDSSCWFPDEECLLHFTKRDAQNECDHRNNKYQ